MCSKNKVLIICLLHCFFFLFVTTCGFELDHRRAEIFNHRVKRDGGTLPFRPLFVYRQQQKEKQIRRKQFELQHLHNSIEEYSKLPSNPPKSSYNYRIDPVYLTYQIAASPYQINPAYPNYQNYPVKSYVNYETFPDSSYFADGSFYANQRPTYYDKNGPVYYS